MQLIWVLIWSTLVFPHLFIFAGIDRLRKHFAVKYPLGWKQLKALQPPLDHVCIDMNQLLHSSYRFNQGRFGLYRSFDNLFRLTKPKKSIVFASDGAPPFAKLMLCRERRLENIDMSAYTPGTAFTAEFTRVVNQYIHRRLCRFSNATVYVSSTDVPGEGELKILQYLHTHILPRNHTNSCTDKVLLVGGDSDLILQSLTVCDRIPNIAITHSTSRHSLTDTILHPSELYNCLRRHDMHCNKLLVNTTTEASQRLLTDTNTAPPPVPPPCAGKSAPPAASHALDYILLFGLQGNDYFPKLRTVPMAKLMNDYHDTLTRYQMVRYRYHADDDNKKDGYLVFQNGEINYQFFYMLLTNWERFSASTLPYLPTSIFYLYPPIADISIVSPHQYLLRHLKHHYPSLYCCFDYREEDTAKKKLVSCVGMRVHRVINGSTVETTNEEEKGMIWFEDHHYPLPYAKEWIAIEMVEYFLPQLWHYWKTNNYSHPYFLLYQNTTNSNSSNMNTSTSSSSSSSITKQIEQLSTLLQKLSSLSSNNNTKQMIGEREDDLIQAMHAVKTQQHNELAMKTIAGKRYFQGMVWYLLMYHTGICPDYAYSFHPNERVRNCFPAPSDLKNYLEDCVTQYASPSALIRHSDGSIDYQATLQDPRVQSMLSQRHAVPSVEGIHGIRTGLRAMTTEEACVAMIPHGGEEHVPPQLRDMWQYVQKHYFVEEERRNKMNFTVSIDDWIEPDYVNDYVQLLKVFEQFYVEQRRDQSLPRIDQTVNIAAMKRSRLYSTTNRAESAHPRHYDHRIWTCFVYDQRTNSNHLSSSAPPPQSPQSPQEGK